jgi:hypothetical protein
MTVMLDKALKRELSVGEQHYTLTIAPEGFKLVPKGRRIGVELAWRDLVSGQAALAIALNASLDGMAGRGRRTASQPQAPQQPTATTPRARGRSKGPGVSSRARPSRGRRRTR